METPAIIKQIKGWFSKTIVYIPTIILVYSGISILHYISANTYPTLCTPCTITGMVMTPFMVVTPHCQAIRWVINWSGNQINMAWISLGGYLVYYVGTNITPFIKKQQLGTHVIYEIKNEEEEEEEEENKDKDKDKED
jgi:hypothetical protein